MTFTVDTEVDQRGCPTTPSLPSCSVWGSIPQQKPPSLHLGIPAGMSRKFSPLLQQKIPEDAYCEKHLERLLLFCEDDQVTLCDKCFLSQEHKNHTVHGIQEAAENYRRLFQELLNTLKEKFEVAKSLLLEERERMVMVQGDEQNFKEVIISEYKMMFRLMTEKNETNFQNLHGCMLNPNLREANLSQLRMFTASLEEKYQATVQTLNILQRENMSKLQESEARLCEQLCGLQMTMEELEKKCGESPSALLKDARYLEQTGGSLLVQCLEPAQITDPILHQIPGMSRILEVLQRPITLDPQTAHPCLVLSEDLRSVRLRNIQQGVPGTPGRFDFSASVLGVESFTSGRHYWEVDVEKATKWQLGIYEDQANRKGATSTASVDKILFMGSVMGTSCTFWVFPPLKRASVGERMHRVESS